MPWIPEGDPDKSSCQMVCFSCSIHHLCFFIFSQINSIGKNKHSGKQNAQAAKWHLNYLHIQSFLQVKQNWSIMFAVVCPIKQLFFLLYLHKAFYSQKDKDWKNKNKYISRRRRVYGVLDLFMLILIYPFQSE